MIRFIAALLGALLTASGASAQQLPAEGEWKLIPNSAIFQILPTTAEKGTTWCGNGPGGTNSCNGTLVGTWDGATYDWDAHEILSLHMGGHADAGGHGGYAFNIDQALMGTYGWRRTEPPLDLNGPPSRPDGTCPKPIGSPPDIHTYGGVNYIGNRKVLFLGMFGYCTTGWTAGTETWLADLSADPISWTNLATSNPALATYTMYPYGAVDGNYLYTITQDRKAAKINLTTLGIEQSWTNFAYQPSSSAGAAGINKDHIYCIAQTNALICMPTANFTAYVSRPAGTAAPAGSCLSFMTGSYFSMEPTPDGRFWIWNGGDMIAFKPGANNSAALDECTRYPKPAVAPKNDSSVGGDFGRTYRKLLFIPHLSVLAAFVNTKEGIWLYKPTGLTPPNQPPVANDDFYVIAQDTQASGNLLTNDTDPENAPLTAALFTNPQHGAVTLNTNGTFIYTPAAGYSGSDSFTYTASDGSLTDSATVNVTISPVTPPPPDNHLDCSATYQGELPDHFTMDCQKAEAQPPDPIPPPAGNFTQRCHGAIFCQAFNQPIPFDRTANRTEAVSISSGCDGNPQVVVPYVQNGAMRFDIKSNSEACDAGTYYIQFSDLLGHAIGVNESLFIQWRQFIPEALAHTRYNDYTDGKATSFKLLIVNEPGSSSCTLPHMVVVKGNWDGVYDPAGEPLRGDLEFYHSCGYYTGITLPGPNVAGSIQVDRQPVIPEASQAPVVAAMVSAGRQLPTNQSVSRKCWRSGYDRSGCAELRAGVWVTYQLAREIIGAPYTMVGQSESTTLYPARIRLWQQVDGEASQLAIDSIMGLRGQQNGYGRAWFLPYMTNKDPAQIHADTYTLIDEVIISKQRIPDAA